MRTRGTWGTGSEQVGTRGTGGGRWEVVSKWGRGAQEVGGGRW